MGSPDIPVIISAVVSLPAGWIVSVLIRRESGEARISPTVLIGASLAIGVWAALVVPANYLLAATLGLGWVLLALSVVDALVLRLPDVFTLPLAVAGLLLSLWLPGRALLGHLAGAAAGFLALYLIAVAYRYARGREGLGLGDAKLTAAAGAWLGWQALPSVVLIACAAAFVWIGIALIFRGREVLGRELPFGVPLCFAFWLVWLYGSPF